MFQVLRRFGTLVWKQSREIEVLNYSRAVVYQIYTNQGYLYVCHDKDTDRFTVLKKNEEVDGSFLGKKDVPHLR